MNNNNSLCLGIIPDGNRRWAKQNNVPLHIGYQKGLEKVYEVLAWAKKYPIPDIVMYCFSSENWWRDKKTLDTIFTTLFLQEEVLSGNTSVAFRAVGDTGRFPKTVIKKLTEIEKRTEHNTNINFWALASYGGRNDILKAVNVFVEKGERATEESFSNMLGTKGIPDPHLIIRTGGTKRLSNFLPWESVYSELYFLDTLWPDFSEKEFDQVLEEYRKVVVTKGK